MSKFYSNNRTLLVMTTAPTGLGHLRVMDALEDGMPYKSSWVEIGLKNYRANKIHALGSRFPVLTKITEFYQTHSLAEKIVSAFYVFYLRHKTDEVGQRFSILKKQYPKKKKYIVVCTHFSLAHSISAAKTKLENKLNITIHLFVVVTDDSPQRVWAVKNADVIFVPSKKTKLGLKKFLHKSAIVKIIPFPVSPKLSRQIRTQDYKNLENQVNPNKNVPLQIQIPISGAAVQLPLIFSIVKSFTSAKFNVISQLNPYTENFIADVSGFPNVAVEFDKSSRKTVKIYESVFYQTNKPTLEITKPSEQAFKALITPQKRGGVILLLTSPIGRQENDNLNFLKHHKLIPNDPDQTRLEYYLVKSNIIPEPELDRFRKKASSWRGLKLPNNYSDTIKFITGLKESGLLLSMYHFKKRRNPYVNSDGVKIFWEEVDNFLTTSS